jgi:hypothetical protein
VSVAVDEQVEEEGQEGAETPPEPVSPEPEPDEGEGEDEEAGAAEEPVEPESQAGMPSEREMEKALERLANEATRHANRVSEIMGEDAQVLVPCPRCIPNIPGFVYPAEVRISDEQKVAVKLSIGELVEPEYRQDPNTSTCQTCGGPGKVKTGSTVPREKTLPCESCDGRGWIGPRSARTTQFVAGASGGGVAVEGYPTEEKPLTDPWGRTKDNPLYGVMPGFEPD